MRERTRPVRITLRVYYTLVIYYIEPLRISIKKAEKPSTGNNVQLYSSKRARTYHTRAHMSSYIVYSGGVSSCVTCGSARPFYTSSTSTEEARVQVSGIRCSIYTLYIYSESLKYTSRFGGPQKIGR